MPLDLPIACKTTLVVLVMPPMLPQHAATRFLGLSLDDVISLPSTVAMGRTKVELATDVLEDVRDSSPITTVILRHHPLEMFATAQLDQPNCKKAFSTILLQLILYLNRLVLTLALQNIQPLREN